MALSVEAGELVPTNSAQTFADGLACRDPNADSIALISRGVERIVRVSDDEIAEAIRAYYTDTHNLVEGAGAAPLAAALKERALVKGGTAGVVLSGGNIDRALFAQVLSGVTPNP